MKKLSELKVGDYVYHVVCGWVKIRSMVVRKHICTEGVIGSFRMPFGKFDSNDVNPNDLHV